MVYDDPRFPNRKKKNFDSPLFEPKKAQEPASGETEAVLLPVSGYQILDEEPRRATKQAGTLPDLSAAAAAPPEPPPQPSIPAQPSQRAAARPPVAAAPALPFVVEALLAGIGLSEPWRERLRRFAQNPTRVYAVAGLALGILAGVVFAAFVWNNDTEGRYDLGAYTASAVGLKGQLFVEWDKKVNYRLTLTPAEPEQRAGFAMAAALPQRPLAVEIHLQDSQGFVLCSRTVLVKFDARRAAAQAAPPADEAITQPAPDFAAQDAQEAARERDQDLFRNQLGPDGRVTLLSAQGTIPCTKRDYEKTTNWSFTPDFPSIAEQQAWLKLSEGPPPERPVAKAAARNKKNTLKPLPLTIEGDDSIVDFDVSRGTIETAGRKLFLIDKATAAAANPAWQDYPVNIHFHCDQISTCTLLHSGLGGLRVRMKR